MQMLGLVMSDHDTASVACHKQGLLHVADTNNMQTNFLRRLMEVVI